MWAVGGHTLCPEIWQLVELLSNNRPISLPTMFHQQFMAYDIRFPRRAGQGGKLRPVGSCAPAHERKQLLRLDNSWDDPAVGIMSPKSRAAGTLQV